MTRHSITLARTCRSVPYLTLLLLLVLAGCAAGSDRSNDSDRQPVFYGGVGGSVLSR